MGKGYKMDRFHNWRYKHLASFFFNICVIPVHNFLPFPFPLIFKPREMRGRHGKTSVHHLPSGRPSSSPFSFHPSRLCYPSSALLPFLPSPSFLSILPFNPRSLAPFFPSYDPHSPRASCSPLACPVSLTVRMIITPP